MTHRTTLLNALRVRGTSAVRGVRSYWFAVAAFALIFLFATIAYRLSVEGPIPKAQGSTLRILSAGVELRLADRDVWVTAGDLSPVFQGDELRVSDSGQAALQLFDGSVVLVESGSHLRLVRAEEQEYGAETDPIHIELELEVGKIAVRGAPRPTTDSTFLVVSQMTVGALKGTVFEVEVLSSGESRWTVTEGVVQIAVPTVNVEGQRAIVLVRAEPGTVVTGGNVPAGLKHGKTGEQIVEIARELAINAVDDMNVEVEVPRARLVTVDKASGLAIYSVSVAIEGDPPSIPAAATRVQNAKDAVAEDIAALVPAVAVQTLDEFVLPLIPELPPPFQPVKVEAQEFAPIPGPLYSIPNVVQPFGIAVDLARDRLYVTELAGERVVQVFGLDGTLIRTLVPPGSSYLDRSPMYVAISPEGDIYVTDRLRGVIDVWRPSGEYVEGFRPLDQWSPLGITFDERGYLYVTDLSPGQHRILVFNTEKEIVSETGTEGEGPAQFSFPNGIAVRGPGSVVYVSDSNNGRIVMLTGLGENLGEFGRGGTVSLALPRGSTFDESGRLYVVDRLNSGIALWDFDPTPSFVTWVTGDVDQGTAFNFPNDVASDQDGRLYITDTYNNRIQVWGYQ